MPGRRIVGRCLAPSLTDIQRGDLARDLARSTIRERLSRYPGARELYYPDGEPLAQGRRLLQPDLAAGKLAGKAMAFIRGRGYVTPEDIKTVAMDVLRHRVARTRRTGDKGRARALRLLAAGGWRVVEHEITDVADLEVTKTAVGEVGPQDCAWTIENVPDQVTPGGEIV